MSNPACHFFQRPASLLMTVLIIISVGAVLAYAYISAQSYAMSETTYSDAAYRAQIAAETGLQLALHHIRNYEEQIDQADFDQLVGSQGIQAAVEAKWDDHWGYAGANYKLNEISSNTSITPQDDVASIEVRRYDDLNEDGDPEFNYNPEYYKITVIGTARDKQGQNLAFYPLQAIAHIPQRDGDYLFSNIVNPCDFTSDVSSCKDIALAMIGSAYYDSDGNGPAIPTGVPIKVANQVYVSGSVYSYEVPKIHGYVDGYGFYETLNGSLHDPQPPTGPPYPATPYYCYNTSLLSFPLPQPNVICPAALTQGWGRVINTIIGRPSLNLNDYAINADGTNPDLTYTIDGVTFTARELEDQDGLIIATSDITLGAEPDKTNPANILIYSDNNTLKIDCSRFKISFTGTLVAKQIWLIDSVENVDAADGIDFYFNQALSGFPVIATQYLVLGDTAGLNNTDFDSTIFQGPALIQNYIYGYEENHSGGATFNGFILSNATGTGDNIGQGFYHGVSPGGWDDPDAGYTGDSSTNSKGQVYIVAEINGEPIEDMSLRLINGQTDTGSPPPAPKIIRLTRGDKSITFSDEFFASWQSYIGN